MMIWKFLHSLHTTSGDKIVCKPEKRHKAVLGFIRSAKRSLLLSIFRCDDLDVLSELGEAVARGVDVQVLITGRARGWGKRLGPLTGLLKNIGAQVHTFGDESMKYHAKYMVADDERALIGTLNLTRKCFRRTRDYVLVTQDRGIAAGLKSLFWADAAGSPAPWMTERLIVGPERSRERIESLLASARESILIRDHKLSDPSVLGILSERMRAGVSVQVVSEDDGGGLQQHGRLIVIDGKVAVFGSFSLTGRSLDSRRELAVSIRNPQLVEKLRREFEPGVDHKLLVAA